MDPGISNLETRQAWRWAKVHDIPVARYLSKDTNDTITLKGELGAGGGGIRAPSVARWLGRATDVKALYNEYYTSGI